MQSEQHEEPKQQAQEVQTKVVLKCWQHLKAAKQEPSAFSTVGIEFEAKAAVEAAVLKAKQAAKLKEVKQEQTEIEQGGAVLWRRPEAKRSRSGS